MLYKVMHALNFDDHFVGSRTVSALYALSHTLCYSVAAMQVCDWWQSHLCSAHI